MKLIYRLIIYWKWGGWIDGEEKQRNEGFGEIDINEKDFGIKWSGVWMWVIKWNEFNRCEIRRI